MYPLFYRPVVNVDYRRRCRPVVGNPPNWLARCRYQNQCAGYDNSRKLAVEGWQDGTNADKMVDEIFFETFP